MTDRDTLNAMREAAQWFPGRSDGVAERPPDVPPAMFYLIGDARQVLIGQATHGTDEFYSIRAALTKPLIRSKQFNLVAAEADWPDAYRIKCDALAEPRLERAIGVIYKPESERTSHYFRARMADQFDAVIHVDTTSAVAPLERWSRENSDLPETYPTGV